MNSEIVISAGVFFYSKSTNRFLYLLRNDLRNPNWALPGGKIENNETLLEGIVRECKEEMSMFPDNGKLIPIQKFTNNLFVYHTFFCEIEQEFIPELNKEHCGYAWVEKNNYPKPLHPGLFNTFNIDTVMDKLNLLTKKAA